MPIKKYVQNHIKNQVKYFIKSENGATAIEYGLIATGVAMAIALSVFAFGAEVSDLYDGLEAILTE